MNEETGLEKHPEKNMGYVGQTNMQFPKDNEHNPPGNRCEFSSNEEQEERGG